MIDEKKISFIICTNEGKTLEEALLYINHLKVPESYQIETLCIKDAKSITQAYNQAIHDSDAKYKVYMHQDVFIINKDFIKDILSIFQNHSDVGMIGVAGSKTIPPNGIWWESPHRYGQVYDSHTGKMLLLRFNDVENEYEKVKAVDGLLMITQYDIPWKEDIFDGWHFYDISQCFEFQRAGYDVVIPKQTTPWCIHDCGIVNIQNDYHKYRNIFLSSYTGDLVEKK